MGKGKKHNNEKDYNSDQIAKSLIAEEKDREREHTRNMNRFWLWFGVIILILILLFFLFMTGIWGFADLWNNF